MRICFVGKYPPIQGGVSSESYWAVRGLAEAGHEVFVVTNAAEVESAYRIEVEPAEAGQLTPTFANGGAVRVFQPEPMGPRLGHIPQANPFVSKLAGLATLVVQEFGCDVIVGSYFEPYGVAASMAAGWTNTPVVLQHAGSDLDRLMKIPELAAGYRQMLCTADAVFTRTVLFGRFAGMGVRPQALHAGPPFAMPPQFSPATAPMTVDDIVRLSAASEAPQPDRAFDPAVATIGMYGKPGIYKGTYDLIAALGTLHADGLEFNLVLLSGSSRQPQVTAAIDAAGIADRTWRLPFVPHWRVASFIRACDAVCFLERDFPVPIHGPVVPHEVLATGTCLILSGEIHAKQRQRADLVDGDNVLLVDDPKDHDALAKQLRVVLERPEHAAGIGARGRLVASGFAPFADFVGSWEAVLHAAVRPSIDSAARTRPLGEAVRAVLSWAEPLLGDTFDDLVDEFGRQGHADPADDATTDLRLPSDFCDFLADRVTDGARDVVRYQQARIWAARHDPGQRWPAPTDVLRGRAPTLDIVAEQYPFRCAPMRIERFAYDVLPFFCHTGRTPHDRAAAPARHAGAVGFARLPNLAPTELRVNDATIDLLSRCDGVTRTDDLVEAVLGQRSGEPRSAQQTAAARQGIIAVLARLHTSGVLAFSAAPTVPAPLTSGG